MESLRLLGLLPSPSDSAAVDLGPHRRRLNVSAAARRAAEVTGSSSGALKTPAPARRKIWRFWPAEDEGEVGDDEIDNGRRKGNWVLSILRVGAMWAGDRREVAGVSGDLAAEEHGDDPCDGFAEDFGSEGCTVEIDGESFGRLLRRASVAEAELYAKLSYLCNLAYSIPKIEPANLLKYHGLRLVTSSLEKKGTPLNAEMEQSLIQDEGPVKKTDNTEDNEKEREINNAISASVAYRIAASAASYLQSQTKGILPFRNSKTRILKESTEEAGGGSKVASFMATTNSVTAVIAGKEEMKEAVAKGLSTSKSSPCEWFTCDDDRNSTRYFIIQGSESLASWQTNLLFEPIQFEGLDVLVHRGIYEASKGIYQQMLPEILAHMSSTRGPTKLRFTGHSLGGSLAVLVNLMLLIRGDTPTSSLLPVVTFGSPTIMCGGDRLLQKLGLPQNHVQAIAMHRDIVPRAFSCNFPDHVAKFLKAINRNFRKHPCLRSQKLLYAPMGKLLILQPEEKFSPHHHLLPPETGFFILEHPLPDSEEATALIRAAQSTFLNSPHPLEILSDRAAYGSNGTIYRDHDMKAYLRSSKGVIRHERKLVRQEEREKRRILWWPLVASRGPHSDVRAEGWRLGHRYVFAGLVQGGKETMSRFARMVTSRNLHVLVVLLFPARLLLLGTLSFVGFR